MSTVYLAPNTAEKLEHAAVDSSGAAVTGVTTLRASVRRVSDGYFWDWNDSTFKVAASVVTLGGTMTEVSATSAPGRYVVSWPGSAAGIYAVSIYLSSGSAVANVPAGGELRVGELATASSVAALPTAAQNADAVLDELVSDHTTSGSAGQALGRLDAAVSSRSSHTAADVWAVGTRVLTGIGSSGIASQSSVDALPSASTIAASVASSLATAHGAGSWATATGFATSSALTDVQADVDALTTALAALQADVDALPSASAIGAAVWATAEGSPSSGTYGWAVQLLRQLATNRLEVDTTSSGRQRLFADDATTVRFTWTLRDGTSGAITTPTGSPAHRGAAT